VNLLRARNRPGPGTGPGLALALGAALVTGWAPPLAGQPRGGAEDDTTETAEFIRVLSPSYTTSYNVNRQTTNWIQDFSFGTGLGLLSFNNKTKFDVRTDNGRDEERRNGSNETSIRWSLIKKVPITSTLRLGRNSVVRPNDERETTDTALNLNTNYGWKWFGVRHTLSGGGGYTRRADLSVRNEDRSESKDAGLSGNATWRGFWRADKVSVNASYRESRISKTSELIREDGSIDSRPTRNRNRAVSVAVNYDPAKWLRSHLNLSNNAGEDEFFIVQGGKGALEQKVNDNQTLSASFSMTPVENTKLDWKLSSSDHNLSYEVRNDIASSGNGVFWEGRLKTKVLGADVEGTLSNRKDNLEPATSATTDTRNNLFEGKLTRDLSSKISLRFNWLVRAIQIFFDDPDPTRVLDRDEQRTKLQPALTYSPSQKWEVTASYIRSTSRRVELNPERASQTKDDEDFSVDIEIGYDLSPRTRISQNYSIKAIYTTFDFAPASNRLLATQRIVTMVSSQVTPKVHLSMEHRFTLQDSGPFRFDDSGSRIFSRSLRKYRQELSARVRYAVFSWLTFTADSRFLRTDDVFEATGFRNTTRNLDLREGIQISHSLGAGASFSVNGQYVRSSVQESFWNVVSSLNKDF
jgi:hypothetical protein